METSIDAIITIDTKGIIKSFNSATNKMFGYNGKELTGQNVNVLMPTNHKSKHTDYMSHYINTGKSSIMGVGRKLKASRKNGTEFPIEILIDKVKVGEVNLFTGIIRDISAQKLTEYELRISEERFRTSQEYANIGSWDWNIQTGDLHWSDRISSLFGYGDTTPETTYENFINAVHPEDREKVSQAVTDAVEKDKPYEIEHRVLWQDGTTHWVLEQGAVIRNSEGTPTNMLGVVSDINERKIIEQDSINQRKLLELTQKCLRDYVGEGDFHKISDELLIALLEITKSEYGYMGEVLYDDLGQRYLKTHAISNISWDDDSRKFYEESSSKGMEFRDFDSLFGEALKTGNPVISNTLSSDSRARGLPEGHPSLDSFLGTPIYYGDVLVGMYGLANREGGFDEELIEFLQPYNASYGVIINARRADLEAKKAAKALHLAKKSAEEANKAKSLFLSSMSHELRTPLNAIMGFSQLIQLNGDNLTEQQKSNISEITTASDHLLKLINDVLDLSKVEAGRVDLHIESVDFHKVFEECKKLVSPMAVEKNITIEFNCPLEVEIIFLADYGRVKQVLLNMLSNAIKYNVDGGKVTISCETASDAKYKVIVEDTGKGIAKEYQDEVFSEFNRLGEESGKIEGTGIGLVITKKLVELMGGSIGFESEKDRGSTFWVELPQGKAIKNNKTIEELNDSPLTLTSVKSTLNKNNFIYIEDNAANLRLFVEIFEHIEGAKLDAVADPFLGLDLAKTTMPKAILCDINMPGLNGYEVLAKLKADDKTKDIPVIAVSAEAMEADIERALAAGFHDYLTKPLKIDKLVKIINAFIK